MRPARDFTHVKCIKRFEIKKNFLKKFLNSAEESKIVPLSVESRLTKKIYFLSLGIFPRFSSISKKKSFCFFTKKPRSVLSKFAMSRIVFRQLALFARIHALTKASW